MNTKPVSKQSFSNSLFQYRGHKSRLHHVNLFLRHYGGQLKRKMLGNISDCTKILLLQFTDQKTCNKLTVNENFVIVVYRPENL